MRQGKAAAPTLVFGVSVVAPAGGRCCSQQRPQVPVKKKQRRGGGFMGECAMLLHRLPYTHIQRPYHQKYESQEFFLEKREEEPGDRKKGDMIIKILWLESGSACGCMPRRWRRKPEVTWNKAPPKHPACCC